MEYCVYKHTSPDGRVYIGITSQKPEARWQAGNGYRNNSYFTRCIKKYGWDNFTHEILFTGLSEEDAKTKEITLIAEHKSNDRKYGYNISSGGESRKGTHLPDWQKKLISEANRGKIVSKETRQKLSVANKRRWANPDYVQHMREINTGAANPMFGRKLSEEQKLKRNAVPVLQYTKEGELIGEFISLRDANQKTGVNRGDISKCCRNIFRQAGGYVWEYKKGK